MDFGFHGHEIFRACLWNRIFMRMLFFTGKKMTITFCDGSSFFQRDDSSFSVRAFGGGSPLLSAGASFGGCFFFFRHGLFQRLLPLFFGMRFFCGLPPPLFSMFPCERFCKNTVFSDVILGMRYFSSVFFFPAAPCLLISGWSFG